MTPSLTAYPTIPTISCTTVRIFITQHHQHILHNQPFTTSQTLHILHKPSKNTTSSYIIIKPHPYKHHLSHHSHTFIVIEPTPQNTISIPPCHHSFNLLFDFFSILSCGRTKKKIHLVACFYPVMIMWLYFNFFWSV